jgi:hypothetical protein
MGNKNLFLRKEYPFVYKLISDFILSFVNIEVDLGTKVHKSEERFKGSSNNYIKSLAAKSTLPLQKGEYCLIPKFRFSCFSL